MNQREKRKTYWAQFKSLVRIGDVGCRLWRLVGGIDDVQGGVADKECAHRKTAVSENNE